MKIIAFLLIIIFASALGASFFARNPDYFPKLPASVWAWLDTHYKSSNAEEVFDLEFIVAWSLSAVMLTVTLLLSLIVYKKVQPK